MSASEGVFSTVCESGKGDYRSKAGAIFVWSARSTPVLCTVPSLLCYHVGVFQHAGLLAGFKGAGFQAPPASHDPSSSHPTDPLGNPLGSARPGSPRRFSKGQDEAVPLAMKERALMLEVADSLQQPVPSILGSPRYRLTEALVTT